MPGIPSRQDPYEGSYYLSQIVGERAREVRSLRGSSQEDIAERMEQLGHHSWKRQTVGQVEQGKRNLTVDELISLAAAIQTTMAFLLSPHPMWSGRPGEEEAMVDVGGQRPLDRQQVLDLYGFQWPHSPSTNIYYDWDNTTIVERERKVRLGADEPSLIHAVSRAEAETEAEELK